MSNQGSASRHLIINTDLWTLRSLILLSLFTFAPALTSAAVPIPSSITVSNIGPTGATVTWTTDVPSTSQVEYGLTTAYGSRTIKDMRLVTAHSLPLVALSQNTLYHFRVLSDDSAGSTAVSGDSTLTTLAPLACAPAPTNSQILDVRSYGATGNGSTDDTVAIQNAINAVVPGGTVLVPAGTYMMNTARIPAGNIALELKSNMTFKMEPGAVLKAMPSSSTHYNVIFIQNASNVSVVGGTLLGERGQHIGSSGEWGMGIAMYTGQNIAIDGVTSKDMWGDGFYVDQHSATPKSTGITFCNVVADNNRRQGMSIVWADGVMVRDSVFKNTNGTPPAAGIDIEPDASKSVNNVTITGSQSLDNVGGGFVLYGPGTGGIFNTTISNNFVRHKDPGIWLNNPQGTSTVTGNVIQPGTNPGYGIALYGVSGTTVSENSIRNTGWDGIRIQDNSDNNIIASNFVEGSSQNTGSTWSNILLSDTGTTSNANIIKCNVLRAGNLTKKPNYGINVMTSGVTNTQLLTNNLVNSGTAGTINDSGVGTLISSGLANCPGVPPPPPTCTRTALNVSGAISDGGFAYSIGGSFGTPADNNNRTQSTLRFFENGLQLGPAHSPHADIRNLGVGRFSHWSSDTGTGESLRFSASNNTDPRTNGRSYAYTTGCIPDTTPPSSSITAPAAGTTVSGTAVTIAANASDNGGVAGVQFNLDGVNLGAEDTTAPYSVVWDSTTATNATHTLTAVARDVAGNITTSSAVTVTVSNAASCTRTALNVSGAISDGGFAYYIGASFGTPADNNNSTQSTLRFFENGLALGPPHSVHADIRNLGQGRFSHWSVTNGTGESLRFAASDNTDPRTNGRSYAYCNPAALLAPGRLRLSP